ncbi:Mobile element protein [Candidatus Enterovibrio altilux]|uniref:Mobile element protein n=1 Tax=Candidatus Enterovibrio altilux TaxID=1927128 RepID=A0A291B711_9GAMM|nr:Mobile element protein [Candidatus Enterovibrio luxaltus]
MKKPRYKITNLKQYNQVLSNRGSLTFWINKKNIQLWNKTKQGNNEK